MKNLGLFLVAAIAASLSFADELTSQQDTIEHIMENENVWSYSTEMIDLDNDGTKEAVITYIYGTHQSGIRVIEFDNDKASVIFEETCSTPNARFDVIDNMPTLIFEESDYTPDYATGKTHNKVYQWDGKVFARCANTRRRGE